MKKTISLLIILLSLNSYSQTWKAPALDDCKIIKDTTSTIFGKLIAVFIDDTLQPIQQIPVNYCQSDSLRVVFEESCPISPLIKKGILNGNVFKDAGFHLTYYKDIQTETFLQYFKNEKGNIDQWQGYYIFFGTEESDSLTSGNKRIFQLINYSGGGDEYNMYYLELENMSSTINTTLSEFMKNAYITCLKYWWSRI